MRKLNINRGVKWKVSLIALALSVAIPFAVLAETAAQTATAPDAASAGAAAENTTDFGPLRGRGGRGFGMGGFGLGGYRLDTGALTEAQKSAYESAVALYEQVEDAVLNDLVGAGVVAQADVDAYVAQRAAQKSLAELDQSGWTAEQYKAFYEANAKTGDDRKAAMQALADAGQLTQAQADALGAQGQSDLWARICQNANTNSTIQTAIATLRQARQTLNNSLREAGIEGVGMGKGMFGGFGMAAKGCEFGQDNGRSGNSNRMQGGRGGRR